VHLFVNEQYNPKYDYDMPEGVVLQKKMPFAHLVDYKSQRDLSADHRVTVEQTQKMLSQELRGFDMAWTHDLVFQGWHMPYGLGIQRSTLALPDLRWLHWIHSIPCTNSDWWDMKLFGRRHKLVSPTVTERQRVAEQYCGTVDDVRVIPHIKDLRSWYDFSEDTCAFIADHPMVMHADVVQVYPASADRLSAKQVDKVIRIFASIKQRGYSVCLVCADQWATGKVPRENEEKVLTFAKAVGLTEDEFIFTSRWLPDDNGRGKFALGISKQMLRELQLCSNLFVFPTIQESFGLVGPEAALSGALVVTNKSLYNQGEVFEHQPITFDFGSYHNDFVPTNDKGEEDWDGYLDAVAGVIVQRMRECESVRVKTIVRRKLNYDTLFFAYYEPIMKESAEWTKAVA
jgi:glycosyltransferase involved in cell wall biosynthesis